MEHKPEYFRLHEVEDREHFKKLQNAIDKLPGKEDLDRAVKEAVTLHVNGKIDKLHEKLDLYIAADEKWKNEEAMPAIKGYNKGVTFFSVLGAFSQYMLPLLGLIGIVYTFLMWLK